MKQLSANTSWFTFTAHNGNFAVYSFTGAESINSPYEFAIELVSRSANEGISDLLGTPACLFIADRSGRTRPVHGLIREMKQLHTANRFTHYRAVLVPRLWYLSQITDHRIFQNLSVVEIIQQILKEQGFNDSESSFKLGYAYEAREYCVQYGETVLHFLSRLCEEEGIYFYFEHSTDSHCLCFCDREGGPRIDGESDLRFYQGSGMQAETSVVSRLNLRHSINSNAAAFQEWNFKQPQLNLYVNAKEPEKRKAPVPRHMHLEQYQYHHLYQSQKDGTRYVNLQLERQLTFSRVIECQSDVSRFLPSYTFTVCEHPREDVNAAWWVFSVHHAGEQPGVLEHEAASDRGHHYISSVRAIPELTRFIAPQLHPKVLVPAEQTAIVVGPAGEEIYPDEYGRVKVQFFWDREGEWNENSTCWLRVSQGWAGNLYGSQAIPRIGHEVIVSFLEGDPDRPLITGRVYHELNQPPYQLPENKTRTVFKSMSTPGTEGEARGFNEVRIEDMKGAEEIYVHAEKDVNVRVKNDWKEQILRDYHRTISNSSFTKTEGETNEKYQDQRKVQLSANDNVTVHGDRHFITERNFLSYAGDEIHLDCGIKIVLAAGSELTLKAGGSWLTLDASGVHGGPKVFQNSGNGPSSGTPANPLLPEGANVQPEPPRLKVGCLIEAARKHSPALSEAE